MKYFAILFFSFLMFSNVAFAQDNYKKHKVVKGETITDIAKKYKVAPYDIYRLNPDSQKGLKEGGILLIPNETKKEPTQPVKEQPTKVANTVHEVEAKETLYSLAKKYNVSVDDIKKANGDSVKDGLRIGQKVIIPIKGSAVAAQVKVVEKEAKKEPPAYFYHTVAAGETKYSIAKQYNMTLQLLEELNPEIKDLLPLNFKLKLDKTAIIAKETEPVANVPVTTPSPVAQEFMIYKVQPKETLYNLTKKTGLTENQILALNPQAKEGLKEGMELKLPKAKAGIVASDTVMAPGMMADLSKSLKKSNSRELALLLPFNMNRVESDTIRMQLLRSDKFLNMTLDFYAGALMAIDSAKVLGLPLKVKILDSKETKNTSDIESLRGSLTSADAVVGPFFQSNVEKTADLLGTGIPVVSPLSKEPGRPYPNLFQSMPPPDKVKMAMLDYLKKKDANVVAVVDPKKASSRVLIKNNYPSARFADGAITAATVKLLLVKDKMNYVIMESESTGMIKNTTKILFEALPEYQIQLVVLEKTDELDNDEIPLARLTALKLMYPSVTNDSDTPESLLFAKVFKQKNGIFPNQFATRGFDVTFDVILRMFQEEEFKEVMGGVVSEQIENKFAYAPQNGGNYNTGVFIMYYDQDLSVKQAQ